MKTKDAYSIAVSVLFFTMLILVGTNVLTVVGYPSATQTQGQFNWQFGSGICGGGQNPAVSGEGLPGSGQWSSVGEIFSQDKYYISWNSNGGVSESVNAAGTLFACDPRDSSPTTGLIGHKVRYVFSIDNGNGTFVPFLNPAVPNGLIQYDETSLGAADPQGRQITNLQGQNFKINGFQFTNGGSLVGITDGATLRVQVQVDKVTCNAILQCTDNWYLYATDYASLRSGITSGYWDKALYHINENATFHWSVPVVQLGGQTAYFLSIVDDDTGAAVGGYSNFPITSLHGSATVNIASTLFVGGGINQLHAYIYTPILLAQSTPVSIRFSATNGPVINSVTFNQAYYHQGDTVFVTWTASRDASTGKPILRYRVEADILGNQVFQPQFVTAANVSFNAASTGPLDVYVTAYDDYGPGAVYHAQSTVGNPTDICRLFPELPKCGGGPGPGNIPSYVTFLALLFLGIGLPALLIGLYVPMSPGFKALLIIVGIGLTLAGAFFAVTAVVDSLAVWLNLPSLPIKWWT